MICLDFRFLLAGVAVFTVATRATDPATYGLEGLCLTGS